MAVAGRSIQLFNRAFYHPVMREMQTHKSHSPCYPPFMGSIVGGIRHKQGKNLVPREIKIHNGIRKIVKKRRILLITKLTVSIVKDVGIHMQGDRYGLSLSKKAGKARRFVSLKSEWAKALVKALCLLAWRIQKWIAGAKNVNSSVQDAFFFSRQWTVLEFMKYEW